MHTCGLLVFAGGALLCNRLQSWAGPPAPLACLARGYPTGCILLQDQPPYVTGRTKCPTASVLLELGCWARSRSATAHSDNRLQFTQRCAQTYAFTLPSALLPVLSPLAGAIARRSSRASQPFCASQVSCSWLALTSASTCWLAVCCKACKIPSVSQLMPAPQFRGAALQGLTLSSPSLGCSVRLCP